jgi:hypothetical protein
MSDPITFESASPRLGLPLLFAGQAQKEAFVNEALSIIDGLAHGAVEGELASPPSTLADGQAWLIGSSASGAWTGHSGQIALRQSGQWIFVEPQDGMRLLNRSTGQDMRRAGNVWRAPSVPGAPSGGTVVDAEARATLTALLVALRQAGIFPL